MNAKVMVIGGYLLVTAVALGLTRGQDDRVADLGLRSLSTEEMALSVGQTGGCPLNTGSGPSAPSCVSGATVCLNSKYYCCNATPTNQNTACTSIPQYQPNGSQPSGAWQFVNVSCTNTYSLSPCYCGWDTFCYADTTNTSTQACGGTMTASIPSC